MVEEKDKISVLYSHIEVYPCPECKKSAYSLDLDLMEKYFYQKPISCPHCKSMLNLWDMLINFLELGYSTYVYALIGGINSTIKLLLKPNETITLDFEKLGMPKGAKILHLGYTPNAPGLFPVELHGNTPLRYIIPKKILIFGRPVGETDFEKEVPVIVGVDWVPMNDDNDIWYNLIEAFEALGKGQFTSTIIPANVTVEAKLYSIMVNYFENICGKERSIDFLNNAATYSYQLNVLLPLLSDKISFPNLPTSIVGNLNRLRNLRNELAHKGSTAVFEKKECITLLLSTFFCMSYLILFEKKLIELPIKND